jgi:hypothetical protein
MESFRASELALLALLEKLLVCINNLDAPTATTSRSLKSAHCDDCGIPLYRYRRSVGREEVVKMAYNPYGGRQSLSLKLHFILDSTNAKQHRHMGVLQDSELSQARAVRRLAWALLQEWVRSRSLSFCLC